MSDDPFKKPFSSLSVNENGKFCHPDSPAGAGGCGGFRQAGPLNNDSYFTMSPLGLNHYGDFDKRNVIYGRTPGSLGVSDPGDPDIMRNAQIIGQLPSTGGELPKKDTFKIAIELFRKSPQVKEPTGIKVLKVLENAYKDNKLKFKAMPEDGLCDLSTGIIEITSSYKDDPLKTSNWLVHEAYHLSVKDDGMLEVDEEIESRKLQASYELFLLENKIMLPDGSVYQKTNESNLLSIFKKDQLIDWVLTIPGYTNNKDFGVDKDWILKHRDDWGGLCNRTLNTRKYYAKILVDSQPIWRSKQGIGSIDPKVAVAISMLLNCERGIYAATIKKAVGEEDINTILEAKPTLPDGPIRIVK